MNATSTWLETETAEPVQKLLNARKAYPELRPAESEEPEAALVKARKILLADDDPGVREMLGRVLESEAYRVFTARTGREAAQKFATEKPDLVLLDLNMPDKDGWEAFALMCRSDPMIPVIVITARPGQHTIAIELGIDALMEKPLNLTVLLETVRQLLAETELERTRRLTNPQFKTKFLNPPRRAKPAQPPR